MEENELSNLDWKGDKYAWCNGHKDDSFFTKERLDRALANLKWREILGDEIVEVLTLGRSDNKPILFCIQEARYYQDGEERLAYLRLA